MVSTTSKGCASGRFFHLHQAIARLSTFVQCPWWPALCQGNQFMSEKRGAGIVEKDAKRETKA